MMITKLGGVLVALLLCTNAFAETETTADVTENSAGATTSCGTRCTNYNFDPRTCNAASRAEPRGGSKRIVGT